MTQREKLTELQLAMNAGARAIEQNKKLQGTFYCYDPLGDSQEIPYAEAARILRNTDAVPVVRCRECKHRGTDDCPMHIKGVPADEGFLKMVDNDFCSYGERRSNNK